MREELIVKKISSTVSALMPNLCVQTLEKFQMPKMLQNEQMKDEPDAQISYISLNAWIPSIFLKQVYLTN